MKPREAKIWWDTHKHGGHMDMRTYHCMSVCSLVDVIY